MPRVMGSGVNHMVIRLRTQYRYIFDMESLDSVIFVMLRAARAAEPRITTLLQSLADRFGGRMKSRPKPAVRHNVAMRHVEAAIRACRSILSATTLVCRTKLPLGSPQIIAIFS